MNALGEFLERERIARNESRREFAKHIHTSADTLVRMIEQGEQPTIKFLRSVSGYTGASLLALLQMAFPDEIRQPGTDVMILAQDIDNLPEPQRGIVIDLIRAALKSSGNGGNEGKIAGRNKRKP